MGDTATSVWAAPNKAAEPDAAMDQLVGEAAKVDLGSDAPAPPAGDAAGDTAAADKGPSDSGADTKRAAKKQQPAAKSSGNRKKGSSRGVGGGKEPWNGGYPAGAGPVGPGGQAMHAASQFSAQNLYLRGLPADTTDESLHTMCSVYGSITSAKAIMERNDGKKGGCKGYGFVMFEDPAAAAVAIKGLTDAGTEAAYARLSTRFPATASSAAIREDPTNLYFSNLPTSMNEAELEALLVPYGEVVSSRILREHASEKSRGVGFARMTSREHCLAVIGALDGQTLGASTQPLLCKFADNPNRRRASANKMYQIGPRQAYGRMDKMYPQMMYPGAMGAGGMVMIPGPGYIPVGYGPGGQLPPQVPPRQPYMGLVQYGPAEGALDPAAAGYIYDPQQHFAPMQPPVLGVGGSGADAGGAPDHAGYFASGVGGAGLPPAL